MEIINRLPIDIQNNIITDYKLTNRNGVYISKINIKIVEDFEEYYKKIPKIIKFVLPHLYLLVVHAKIDNTHYKSILEYMYNSKTKELTNIKSKGYKFLIITNK